MHELTLHELDAELAEQLPSRELMAVVTITPTSQYATAVALAGNQVGGHNVSIANVNTAIAVAQNIAVVAPHVTVF